MTWKEFKDYIDSELAKEGVSESTKIEYIDITTPKTPSRDNKFNYHVLEIIIRDGTIRIIN